MRPIATAFILGIFIGSAVSANAMNRIAAEQTCVIDSDCDTSNCEYCLSEGHCSSYDSEYCDSFPCGVGDGDCDPGTCPSGYVCGYNNFLEFHPLLSHCASGYTKNAEVCIEQVADQTCITDSDCDTSNCQYCLSNGLCSSYDSEYCDSFYCGVGDGDCDSGTCPSGFVCGYNNFLEFHPLLSHCASGNTKNAEVCIRTEACGIKPNAIGGQIIGGDEAGPYSLPWQVALVAPWSSRPFCGGTLISDRHVLTAAHCTGANGGVWDVMVGEDDVTDSSDGTRHTVCRWQNHPDYNSPSPINNDFAIVTLTQAVTIGTRANYACLPTSAMSGSFLDDKTVTVSGWGRLVGGGATPSVLYKVDLPGMSNSACSELSELSLPITHQMLCAGRFGENAVGACHGDSGGPLTYTDGGITTLVGAVSWGNSNCLGTTVFARVTEVLPWIQEQMLESC